MIRFTQAAGRFAAVTAMAVAMAAAAGTACASEGARKQAQKPFKILGNTYYVGTAGYSSVLVVSDYGQVLIDTGPKEVASQVAANIESLGFKLAELKAILVSDARAEHSGGAFELQQRSGAQIYTTRPGDQKLRSDKSFRNDPREGAQVGASPLVPQVWVVQDGQLLGIASVRVRSMATPGAPESISWSWDACDGSKCLPAVYAADLKPEGRKGLKDAEVRKGLEASIAKLEGATCELLFTPDPRNSGGLARLEKAAGKLEELRNANACKTYAQQARAELLK